VRGLTDFKLLAQAALSHGTSGDTAVRTHQPGCECRHLPCPLESAVATTFCRAVHNLAEVELFQTVRTRTPNAAAGLRRVSWLISSSEKPAAFRSGSSRVKMLVNGSGLPLPKSFKPVLRA
jgi:hypothetical protein